MNDLIVLYCIILINCLHGKFKNTYPLIWPETTLSDIYLLSWENARIFHQDVSHRNIAMQTWNIPKSLQTKRHCLLFRLVGDPCHPLSKSLEMGMALQSSPEAPGESCVTSSSSCLDWSRLCLILTGDTLIPVPGLIEDCWCSSA